MKILVKFADYVALKIVVLETIKQYVEMFLIYH